MATYNVRGLTVATAATLDHAICAVWNPHATRRIALLEYGIFATAAPGTGAACYLRRITARGTAGSTATPGIVNSAEADAIPPSGFLLDLAAYTVQPTLAAAPGMGPGFVFGAVAGSGIISPMRPIYIPAGQGIALLNGAAIIVPASHVHAVVDD